MDPRWVILALISMGLGMGLFQSPNNNVIMGVVPHNKLGVASAFLATVRNLGQVTGTSLSMGLVSWRAMKTGDLVLAYHFAYFFSGIVAIGSALACLGRSRRIARRLW